MKRTLIASLLAVAALSSASVFAQSVGTNNGPVTRAQVKAELVAAKESGQLNLIHTESYPQLLPYQTARNVDAARVSGPTLTQANGPYVRAE